MDKIVIFSILIFISIDANACSCIPTKPEQRVMSADSIIEAKLISAGYSKGSYLTHEVEGKFKIFKVYKGKLKRNTYLQLTTSDNEGLCGMPMVIGRHYLIFKSKNSNSMGICSGTRFLGNGEYLKKLMPYIKNYHQKK
ncbi:hypothetical protein [Aliikangiella sp. IMCC44359]|uniref:hypothetical protein n=1 Tax=Aliikangiella sp. IMCC44359 TaxID=3459125 RepID=UPI00403ABC22